MLESEWVVRAVACYLDMSHSYPKIICRYTREHSITTIKIAVETTNFSGSNSAARRQLLEQGLHEYSALYIS